METSIDSESLSQGDALIFINNNPYKVSDNVPIGTSLAKYIRDYAHLYGTKTMCNEGGCGACIVKVHRVDPVTEKEIVFSVNSCLVPVFACHGWSITTVEGLGDKIIGYDKVQLRLAQFNGTQCGFCSSGMVMSMSSLLDKQKSVKLVDIDKTFDGNICRCTGYRSILAAFKSFAEDAPVDDKNTFCDIEDLQQTCLLLGKNCSNSCENGLSTCKSLKSNKDKAISINDISKASLSCQLLEIKQEDSRWLRVKTKKEIFSLWDQIVDESYLLVAGNTAQGVYRLESLPKLYIDVNNVAELKGYTVSDTSITIGANTTLVQLIDILQTVAKDKPLQFKYLKNLADHVELIGNVSVRNLATLAGNLCIKHQHPDFPSDVFVILETVGARITLEKEGSSEDVSIVEFLKRDLLKVLISRITLPALDSQMNEVQTYKIMPRFRAAHAYVNAGFLLKVDKANNFLIKGKPNIVYGGISSDFVHAAKTELYILEQGQLGKSFLDESVLQSALEILSGEVIPSYVPPEASVEYRTGLTTSLFYKCLLHLCPESVNSRYKSGSQPLIRPAISKGSVDYATDKSLWPVNKPISKIEALYQCSGEAQFLNDIPCLPNELHGALVLTTVGAGKIVAMDPSIALKLAGVVAFYSAKDVPGKNNFTPVTDGVPEEEVLFCDGNVLYHGQPVGIIVANSYNTALQAANKVIIHYAKANSPPAFDMKEIIKNNDEARIHLQAEITPSEKKAETPGYDTDPVVSVSGKCDLPGQYHFTMELQTCVCIPVEDGLDVYSSTQWIQHVQDAVANVLNVPSHSINMKIRRIGGGYGAKLTRSSMVAAACAVASKLLNRPVRLVLSLETNMRALGKRYPCYTQYHAKVNTKTGKIIELDAKMYEDAGCTLNDPVVEASLIFMAQTYNSENWSIKGFAVKTDHASNTWCRSPGSTEGIATIEGIMEGIASAASLDPVMLRLANLKNENTQLVEMVDYWIEHIEYKKRVKDIEKYNEENWWKQKGISLVPIAYGLGYVSMYSAMVSIYAFDGTVAVTHGGIECGQGINTKVAQVCAHTLGIDMSYIQVKPSDNLTSPNNQGTGGSVTSESASFAALMCCQQLLDRLKPFREEFQNSNDWPQLIKKAYAENVNLNASYMFTVNDPVKDYMIYGVTAVEVEVDILTGQHLVTRADILEDAGISLSPQVDIGQVEGAFIMGLGYYTTEQLIYDSAGELKTNRTWNYYPPGAQDIPVDLRVEIQKNSINPSGVLRSKATGEPPLCMSVAIVLAIQNAFSKPRNRNGAAKCIDFNAPMTPEKIFLSCNNDIKSYKFK